MTCCRGSRIGSSTKSLASIGSCLTLPRSHLAPSSGNRSLDLTRGAGDGLVNVLVVGNGAREHALCWSLAQSAELGELYCAPGNAGTAELATNLPSGLEDCDDLVEAAVARRVSLVIVGPEAALAAG